MGFFGWFKKLFEHKEEKQKDIELVATGGRHLVERGSSFDWLRNKNQDEVLRFMDEKRDKKETDYYQGTDKGGDTALHVAAEEGFEVVVQKLLTEGVYIDDKNAADNTALHVAAKEGRAEVVELLLKKGADITAKNNVGDTALHVATDKGFKEVVTAFSQNDNYGKCFMEENGNKQTALELAMESENEQMMEIFLKSIEEIFCCRFIQKDFLKKSKEDRSSPSFKDSLQKGRQKYKHAFEKEISTVINRAIRHKKLSLDVVKKFIQYGYPIGLHKWVAGSQNLQQAVYAWFLVRNTLFEVMENGKQTKDEVLKKIKGIIDRNGDDRDLLLKGRNKNGNSLLHIAAEKGNEAVVKWLLEQPEVEVDVKNYTFTETALHVAAWKGRVEVVKLLLEKKADINAQNVEKDTALHFAVKRGFMGVVKLLLEKKADINAQNIYGETALDVAAEKGRVDVVKLFYDAIESWTANLVKKFIQYGYFDKKGQLEGKIPKGGRDKKEWQSALKLLQFRDELFVAVQKGTCRAEELKGILAGYNKEVGDGVDKDLLLKVRNENGASLLHMVAERGYVEVVEWLLEKGADIEAKNKYDNTALYRAATRGHVEVVEKLLEKKANIEAKNENGNTALHVAASEGRVGVVEVLLKNKANVEAKNRNGNTALYLAVTAGHAEVVEVLLKNKANIHIKNIGGKDMKGKIELLNKTFLAQKELFEAMKVQELEVSRLEKLKGILNRYNVAYTKMVKGDTNWLLKVRNEWGDSLLYIAAGKGYKDVVKWLLDEGVEVDAKNSRDYTALHGAAEGGNLEVVKLLLEKRADIDAKNKHGNTALHVAASEGRVGVVEVLLKNKADIDAKNKYGNTALECALREGHGAVVTELIKNSKEGTKFNFKMRSFSGRKTLLHMAAEKGDKGVVQKLLEKSTEVEKEKEDGIINVKDINGDTALHVAAGKGDLEVVKFLVRKGANIEAKNKYGNTALHLVVQNWSYKEIVNSLLEGINGEMQGIIDLKNNDGDTALHVAAKKNHVGMVEALLEKGANIKAEDNHGNTALHVAARNGNLEVVKVLLKNKRGINVQNKDGRTPLHEAISFGKVDVAEYLAFQEKTTVIADSVGGATQLHLAAWKGYEQVVNELLKKCGNKTVNIQDGNGNTPLHLAAREGHAAVVKLLLKKKANINIENIDGKTVLDVAAEKGHAAVVELFYNEMLTMQEPLTARVMKEFIQYGYFDEKELEERISKEKSEENKKEWQSALKLLQFRDELFEAVQGETCEAGTLKNILSSAIEDGVDKDLLLKVRDAKKGNNLLHMVAERGHGKVVEWLLEKGADVEAKNKHGNTALYVAARKGKLEVVEALVEKGANIDAQNGLDDTALHVAAGRGHRKVVEWLLGKGANIGAKNMYGNTALHMAAGGYDLEVVKALLEKGADITVKNNVGDTALHAAVDSSLDNVEMVRWLLEKGANIEAKNIYGNTALHAAAAGGFNKVVEWLLEKGADINATNNDGKTALNLASKEMQNKIRNFILTELKGIPPKKTDKVKPTSENKIPQKTT